MRTKRIIINHTDNILKYRTDTLQLDKKKKKKSNNKTFKYPYIINGSRYIIPLNLGGIRYNAIIAHCYYYIYIYFSHTRTTLE